MKRTSYCFKCGKKSEVNEIISEFLPICFTYTCTKCGTYTIEAR